MGNHLLKVTQKPVEEPGLKLAHTVLGCLPVVPWRKDTEEKPIVWGPTPGPIMTSYVG